MSSPAAGPNKSNSQLGAVVYTYNASYLGVLRQEHHKFKVSPGNLVTVCLKT